MYTPPRGGGLWGPVTSFVGTWYSQFFHIWAVSIAGWWGCVLRFVSLVIGHWGSSPVLCWFLSFSDEVFAQIFHSFWCWVGCCFAERCLVCCRFKVPDTIGSRPSQSVAYLLNSLVFFGRTQILISIESILYSFIFSFMALYLWNFSLNQSQNNFSRVFF